MRRQDLLYAVLIILLLTGAALAAGSPDREARNHSLNWDKTYTGPCVNPGALR